MAEAVESAAEVEFPQPASVKAEGKIIPVRKLTWKSIIPLLASGKGAIRAIQDEAMKQGKAGAGDLSGLNFFGIIIDVAPEFMEKSVCAFTGYTSEQMQDLEVETVLAIFLKGLEVNREIRNFFVKLSQLWGPGGGWASTGAPTSPTPEATTETGA